MAQHRHRASFVALALAWGALCTVPAGCAGADRTDTDGSALLNRSAIRVNLGSLPEFRVPPDPKPVPAGAPAPAILGQDQVAPFDGILVSEEWMTWHHEVVLQRDRLKVRTEALVDLVPRLHSQCLDGLEKTAAAAERSWWESPALNRWGGFLGGVVVTVVLVLAADRLNDQVGGN